MTPTWLTEIESLLDSGFPTTWASHCTTVTAAEFIAASPENTRKLIQALRIIIEAYEKQDKILAANGYRGIVGHIDEAIKQIHKLGDEK